MIKYLRAISQDADALQLMARNASPVKHRLNFGLGANIQLYRGDAPVKLQGRRQNFGLGQHSEKNLLIIVINDFLKIIKKFKKFNKIYTNLRQFNKF